MANHVEISAWQAACQTRAALYRWFAASFAEEVSHAALAGWMEDGINLDAVFKPLGLEAESRRLQVALAGLRRFPANEQVLELAADFAQLFLLSPRESALPYASHYLNDEGLLQGDAAKNMQRKLKTHALSRHPDFRESDDHLSVYLRFMSVLCEEAAANDEARAQMQEQQRALLEENLLPWLPQMVKKAQDIPVVTDIYPALLVLLLAFVRADTALLQEKEQYN